MPTFKLNINGSTQEVTASPDMPLLWVLRDALGLLGTMYGCGIGERDLCRQWALGQDHAPDR